MSHLPHSFYCVVCNDTFISVPDLRVPNCSRHYFPHLFYCVLCHDIFISIPDFRVPNCSCHCTCVLVLCVVTFSLASLALGFLTVYVTTLTQGSRHIRASCRMYDTFAMCYPCFGDRTMLPSLCFGEIQASYWLILSAMACDWPAEW